MTIKAWSKMREWLKMIKWLKWLKLLGSEQNFADITHDATDNHKVTPQQRKHNSRPHRSTDNRTQSQNTNHYWNAAILHKYRRYYLTAHRRTEPQKIHRRAVQNVLHKCSTSSNVSAFATTERPLRSSKIIAKGHDSTGHTTFPIRGL